jgi:hypothetical protein
MPEKKSLHRDSARIKTVYITNMPIRQNYFRLKLVQGNKDDFLSAWICADNLYSYFFS